MPQEKESTLRADWLWRLPIQEIGREYYIGFYVCFVGRLINHVHKPSWLVVKPGGTPGTPAVGTAFGETTAAAARSPGSLSV